MAKPPDGQSGVPDPGAPAPDAAAAQGIAAAGARVGTPAYDPRSEILRLSNELSQLHLCVRQIAEVNAIENVLCHGFAEVRKGLDGLRQGPNRGTLSEGASSRLQQLRDALASPNWSSATTLSIKDEPVRFIGTGDLAEPVDGGQAPPFRRYEGDQRSGPSDQQSCGDHPGSAS
jgi:hypothetical protein